MNRYLRLGAAAIFTAGFLFADITYVQTTKFEGGSLIEMMQKMAGMPLMGRMMGGNMKQAFEDQRYDVYVKGDKMARWGKLTSTIYDLDAGTITSIDNNKRTYSTTTFEEMKQRMDQMQQKMSRSQGGDIQFDVKVEKTGQTKSLGGQEANEMLITMTAKQATQQGQMVVKTHAWLVPFTPQTREVTDFYRKMGEKFAYTFSGVPATIGAASDGISAAMKEAAKQDGYAAETETEVSGVSAGPMAAMGGNSDPNAVLIKMLSDNESFVKGDIDASKFAVPADYKEDKRAR